MNPEVIREVLQAIPKLPAVSTGTAPQPAETYYPEHHAAALDPDVSLIIGNRGMGKSFWANALFNAQTRAEIAKRYLGARAMSLHNVDAAFGFASGEGAVGPISKDDLAAVSKKVPTEIIWRAVLLRIFSKYSHKTLPSEFRELVRWVESNPDEQRTILRRADAALSTAGTVKLILFDQLEQMADDWKRIQNLTQGLLRLCLAAKSYRSIRLKIFMRPDQFEDQALFRFQDASKVRGEATTLKWRSVDLYGLLYSKLLTNDFARKEVRQAIRGLGGNPDVINKRLNIPFFISGNEENQAALFDLIAGEAMGGGKKRGRPYTWISTHLADGREEISPRTFLTAIRAAADHNDPAPASTAIDYHGIQEGVRAASQNRLSELSEDYPWVSEALTPLRSLVVPCLPEDVQAIWAKSGTFKTISENFSDVKAPIDLVIADILDESEEEKARALLKVLREIGVVELRDNGKVNFPDIFRVRAGMLRRGGVTPQQRRRL